MIICRKQSKMKNKILPACLQGNYGDSLGEFSSTQYGIVGAERVKQLGHSCFSYWISCSAWSSPEFSQQNNNISRRRQMLINLQGLKVLEPSELVIKKWPVSLLSYFKMQLTTNQFKHCGSHNVLYGQGLFNIKQTVLVVQKSLVSEKKLTLNILGELFFLCNH